jgi:hypothetical protein
MIKEAHSLFSAAEYLTTFTTFIYGYVATQFLSGWSSIITHRKGITVSKEHLLWTILTFFLLIDIWWTSWRKAEDIANDNLLFYSTLITPFIFYFLSHLLFPDLDELLSHNLRTYLTPAFRKIMIAMVFLLISFVLSDQLFDKHPSQNIAFIAVGIGLTTMLIIKPAGLFLRRLVLAVAGILIIGHIYTLNNFHQPFSEVNGYSFQEYLTVFITFIFGFVAWRFLEGWGFIITHFKKLTTGYDYLPWTVLGFLLMMDIWWGSWGREQFLEQSILNFILALVVPILFYFFSAVAFPLELMKRGFVRLNLFYFRNNRLICLFFGLIILSNGLIAITMEESEIVSRENFFRAFAILLAMCGALSTRLLLHRLVLLGGYVAILLHFYND